MQAIRFQGNQEQAPVYGASFQGQTKQAIDQARKNGDLNAVQMPDALAKRQALAKKQAHKIVSDAFAGERKIDSDVQGLNDQVDFLRKDNLEAGNDIAAKRELIDAAREQHGIVKGSAEDKELELWQKGESLEGRASMSDDERKAYADLKKRGLSQSQQDFLEHVGDINEQIKGLERQMDDNDAQIRANNAAVTAIGIERLKSDPMGEAQEEADAILEQANGELISGLFAEAKDHIDEEREETQEAAEEKAEKEVEQKERIEAAKEKKEDQEEQTEEIRDNAPLPNMAKVEETKMQVKDKIDEVLDKLKLLSEDVKGIKVDDIV